MNAERMPAGLAVKGKRLWREATGLRVLNIAELVVLEEACRLADRLDRLALLLDGVDSSWATVRDFERGDGQELVIDQGLSAARLHASTLSKLLADLKLPSALDGAGEAETDDLDELGAARAARVAAAAGQH